MGFSEIEQRTESLSFFSASPYPAFMADGVGMYHIVVERFIALGDVLGNQITLPHETAIFSTAGRGKGYTVSYQPLTAVDHAVEIAYIVLQKESSFGLV